MASAIHEAKTTSIIDLKRNAFVVINGKNKDVETKNGTKGTAKIPAKMMYLSICLFILFTIITENTK